MENRLLLCAGITKRAGWMTLDVKGGDFMAEIPPLPPGVRAIVWDEIEWVHGIGSFYPWVAERVLEEIREVLGVGGKLVLEQPNFDIAKTRVEWLFGDPSYKDSFHMNRWAYTPETLGDLLERVGYHSIKLLPAQYHRPIRDFRMEAYR